MPPWAANCGRTIKQGSTITPHLVHRDLHWAPKWDDGGLTNRVTRLRIFAVYGSGKTHRTQRWDLNPIPLTRVSEGSSEVKRPGPVD